MPGTELENTLSTKLNRLSIIAKNNPKEKFTSLAHLMTEQFLKTSFYELNRNSAAGVDKRHAVDYEKDINYNVYLLRKKLKDKKYRAQDIRRVWIPKPDGGERPLGIPVLEDKIVQKSVATILNSIYEQDFLTCSYGFRENLNCHEALKSVELMVMRHGTNYLLDMDIKGYFDNIDHKWLMKMLEERIKDKTILHLIGKWLKVGVLEECKRTISEKGTPQGGVVSPLLANIYLHYVLDLWLTKKISREMAGRIYLVRYADDFIIGCTHKEDAVKLWQILPERFNKFGLTISKEKSRIIGFGKQSYRDKGNKLKTFDFLGFTHYMKTGTKGTPVVGRKTIAKRMQRTLKAINQKLRENRSKLTFKKLYKMMCQILNGYYRYYGFAGNIYTLKKFHRIVERLFFKWLNRKSQKTFCTWGKFRIIKEKYPFPYPKIYKPYSWIYS